MASKPIRRRIFDTSSWVPKGNSLHGLYWIGVSRHVRPRIGLAHFPRTPEADSLLPSDAHRCRMRARIFSRSSGQLEQKLPAPQYECPYTGALVPGIPTTRVSAESYGPTRSLGIEPWGVEAYTQKDVCKLCKASSNLFAVMTIGTI